MIAIAPRMAALSVLLALSTSAALIGEQPAASAATDADVAALPVTGSPVDPWDALEPVVSASEEQVLRRRGSEPAPSASQAAAAGATGTNWMRSIASLGAVVALIFLLAWGYRAVAGSGALNLTGRGRRPGLIEIVSRTALSPRQSLCLVRVGPRTVLVGVTNERLTALDVIADADLTARLAGQAAAGRNDSNTAAFQDCLEREARDYAPDKPEPREDLAPDELRMTTIKRQLAGTIDRMRKVSAVG